MPSKAKLIKRVLKLRGNIMKRFFMVLIAAALLPVLASAENIKVGISQIVEHPALNAVQKGIIDGIKTCGYEEGKNISYDVQIAQGKMATAHQIAVKFAGDKKDIVIGIATPTALALASVFSKSAPNTPVIFSAVTDPKGAKLVRDLKKPGGMITGVSDLAPIASQFNLFFELGLNPKTVGMIYNAGEQNSRSQLELAKKAAKAKGVKIVAKSVSSSNAVYQTAKSLVGKVDGIYVTTDNTVVSALESVIKIANEAKIPLIMSDTDSVKRGALGAKGFNYYKHGFQTGQLACRVLKGEKPGNISVEFQKELELMLNEKTAKIIGVNLPAELLEKADEVVK